MGKLGFGGRPRCLRLVEIRLKLVEKWRGKAELEGSENSDRRKSDRSWRRERCSEALAICVGDNGDKLRGAFPPSAHDGHQRAEGFQQ